MAQLTTQPRGYLTLTNHLLTQVEQADALSLSEVTAQPGGGLLVSGAESLQVIEHMKGRGYQAHLLPDRQRYKGKNRKLAGQPFTPNWISRQQRLAGPRSSRMPAMWPRAICLACGRCSCGHPLFRVRLLFWPSPTGGCTTMGCSCSAKSYAASRYPWPSSWSIKAIRSPCKGS